MYAEVRRKTSRHRRLCRIALLADKMIRSHHGQRIPRRTSEPALTRADSVTSFAVLRFWIVLCRLGKGGAIGVRDWTQAPHGRDAEAVLRHNADRGGEPDAPASPRGLSRMPQGGRNDPRR